MSSGQIGAALRFIRVRAALQYAFISIALVGAFSLERLVPDLESLGPLAEPRFVIGVAFSSLAVLGWIAGAGRVRMGRLQVCLVILFFALHVLVGCSYFWAADPWFAAQQLEDVSILVLSLLGFLAVFGDDPLAAVRISIRVAIGLAIAVEVLWAASGFEQGAYGIGGIGAARLCGAAALSALFLRYSTGRVAYLLLLAPLLVGILVSGSRASLLALLPALGVVWLGRSSIAGGAVRGTARELTGLIAVGVALVVAVLTPFGSEIFDQIVLSIIGPPSGGGGTEGLYLADRDVIFSHALHAFLDSPISGLGVGTYRGPFGEEYPHNLVLAYAVDAGSVALLMFVGLLAGFASLAIRVRTPLEIFAAAFALFTLVASLFAGSYYDARMFWFMFVALAIQAQISSTSRPGPAMNLKPAVPVRTMATAGPGIRPA